MGITRYDSNLSVKSWLKKNTAMVSGVPTASEKLIQLKENSG